MNKIIYFVASRFLLSPQLCQADDAAPTQAKDAQQLQQQLDDLQIDYDQRLQRIEKRLKQTQIATRTKRANSFNPAISLILNGQYAAYSNNPDDYTLPGFALNDEAGLDPKGFSLGESEVTLGASVDQLFYGQATFS